MLRYILLYFLDREMVTVKMSLIQLTLHDTEHVTVSFQVEKSVFAETS